MTSQKTEIIKVKYLNERDISPKANIFLSTYNPNLKIPVPLEQIVESKLGINILSVKGLRDLIDCDGYISSSFKTITFDDYIYNNFEARTRFTIAHELGHLFLHKELYNSHRVTDIKSFREFQGKLGDDAFKRLEIQANLFAGFVLFPYKPLAETIESAIKACGGQENFGITNLQDLSKEIQQKFGVSERACYIQLKKYYPKIIEIANDAIF